MHGKILVVDDDAFLRGLTGEALETAGYEIVVASDGAEAIKKARDENFDLVVTDILMPKRDGMDVIQEIKQTRPSLKILAISSGGAAGHVSVLQIAEANGSDGSLQKPFTPAQLLEKISEITVPATRLCT